MSEENVQSTQVMEKKADGRSSWTIDTEFGLLNNETGLEKRLEPRLSKLMSLLLTNSGKFVSRRTLIDELWPDTVVTEQSLSRAVSDLRKFLRANYERAPIIETASKQGYRLMLSDRNDVTNATGKSPFRSALRVFIYAFSAIAFFIVLVRSLSY